MAIPKSDLLEKPESQHLTKKQRNILGRKYNNSKTTVKSIDSQLEIVVNEDLDLKKSNFFQSKKLRDLNEMKAKKLKLREQDMMHKVIETPDEQYGSSKKASRLLPVLDTEKTTLAVFPSNTDTETDLNETLLISKFKTYL